ncbi:hypothetical protein AB1Z04_003500 [Vibrio cholerae]|uniref:hypothetical protein n=1 Tax=Vibrio cholerae TaxID=666 RepID=UPI000BA9BFB6|nr:hypothetical protein [Vibrio cholerae]EKF9792879.1 hypothetical protein [Vibrio cholerae]PAS08713.1 hypothetical protein CGT76_18380 [Vibrio cholerae]
MNELWVSLVPDKFSSFIGTVSIVVAFFCMYMTFIEKQRAHATKLFAIMIVVSLSFFASHWGTYFAAIFIVATAVTELDFLQNLAAIISKDKNYFEYRKEALSKEQNIKRKAEEVVEEEFKTTMKSQKSSKSNDKTTVNINELMELPRAALMRMAFDVEDKALDFLSKTYSNIERGVRLSGPGGSIDADGLIFDKKGPRQFFEIKWTRNARNVRILIMHEIRKAQDVLNQFQNITGSVPEYNLVIVVNEPDDIQKDKWAKTLDKAAEANVKVWFLTLEEIGFSVIK